jgi:chorismate synthase
MDIRHVRTHEEFVACVELQAATWGPEFRELVPATILKISQRLGGVTAGAFADDGTLVGFVFGITGVEQGAVVHWSDMLAVRLDTQNQGVGRRLKEFQRDAVRALGVTRMYWTYDPLVARSAHFNLNRLGVTLSEYVPDMYGTDTGSKMHEGLGTDRFIVVWPVTEGGHAAARSGKPFPGVGDAPIINAGTPDGREPQVERFGASLPPLLRVEIPGDIFGVLARAPGLAARWRNSTRQAFQWALGHGYRVSHFEHADAANGYYVLVRTP